MRAHQELRSRLFVIQNPSDTSPVLDDKRVTCFEWDRVRERENTRVITETTLKIATCIYSMCEGPVYFQFYVHVFFDLMTLDWKYENHFRMSASHLSGLHGIFFCNTDWTFEAEWCLLFCNFGSLPVRNSPATEFLLNSSVLLPALFVITYSSILIVCWHVNCATKQLWQHFSTKQRWHSPVSRWYKRLRPLVATISTPLSTLMVLYITIKIEEYVFTMKPNFIWWPRDGVCEKNSWALQTWG